ncbi:MAG: VCBS repeat-containing protein, partial [Planctomycetota bacterium]|nr:VCBS repeat-containing protein [Planctomycetota bacterium]
MNRILRLALCAAAAAWLTAVGQGGGAVAGPGFTDVTKESGVAAALEEKYRSEPKWWLSGLNLVDLDGDGRLDLFLGAHGGGAAVALLGDGLGRFTPAQGTFPPTEIHLAYDINEDGRVDLQMTWQDGGGRWWMNESAPGRLRFVETGVTAGQGRTNAMIDIDRDGKVDWLHERPGVVFELGDGRGGFRPGGGLEVEKTRNEINMYPVDLDGDGFVDLVVHWGRYDFPKGKSRIYMNDGKGRFRDATAEAGLREEGVAVKGVGDLNHDGRPDLLVLEDKVPQVYLNDGHGKFARKAGALAGM